MLGENIKRYRKSKNMTQETLAARLNVVRQTVSKWEKGLSVPDAELLQRLAEVMEVSVSELLGGDGKDMPNEEGRNEIADQLSQINEQLAIRNRRSRRIWRIIGGTLLAVVAVTVILIVLGLYVYSPDFSETYTEVVAEESMMDE